MTINSIRARSSPARFSSRLFAAIAGLVAATGFAQDQQDQDQAPAAATTVDQSIVASLSPPPTGLACDDAARQTSVSFDFARPDFEIKQVSLYVDGHGVSKNWIEQKWPRVTLVHGLHPGRNTVEVVATGDNNRTAARRLTVLVGESPKSGDVTPAMVSCDTTTKLVAATPDVIEDAPTVVQDAPPIIEDVPDVAEDEDVTTVEHTHVIEHTVYVDEPVYMYHAEPVYPIWPAVIPIIPVVIGWFPPPPPVAIGVWYPRPYCPPPAVIYNPAPPPVPYTPPPPAWRGPPHEPPPVSNMYRTPAPVAQTRWVGNSGPQAVTRSPGMPSGSTTWQGNPRGAPYERHAPPAQQSFQSAGHSSGQWSNPSPRVQPAQTRVTPPQYQRQVQVERNVPSQQWRSAPQQQPMMRQQPVQSPMQMRPQPSPQRQSWNRGAEMTHGYRAPVREMQVHESQAMRYSAPRAMAPPRPFTGPSAPMARMSMPQPQRGGFGAVARRGGEFGHGGWQPRQR